MYSIPRLALSLVAALLIFSQPVSAQGDPQGEIPECTIDADCDDGVFCNGVEFCADGGCVALSPCPPAINGCIKVGALCDEENDTCVDVPDDSQCDNGLFCDGQEFCDPESGQCLPGLTCPAAIVGCQIFGACDEEQDACISELDNELCNEGEFCNEGGNCQVVGTDCAVDADCDDGLFCTGAESCFDGQCVALSACPPAIDGCIQVGAICDEENDTCVDFPDDSQCDNGLFCDGQEFCDPDSGRCLPGLICPAAIVGCQVLGACDEDLDECIAELDDSLCADDEFCNEGGNCQVVGTECAVDADCDDGLFCTGGESCVEGSCGVVSACPPGIDGCLQVGAVCDEENDTCLNEPDDDNCNLGEFCDEEGICQTSPFSALLLVAPASNEPDPPFTLVQVVNVNDESTQADFSILGASGETLQDSSIQIGPNGIGTFAASVAGPQLQGQAGQILPASVLVTSDLPLAVSGQVALKIGDTDFPPFGVVPVDACFGWSYVHSESADQRSGIALQNSDSDATASCSLNFFQGVEGTRAARIQKAIPPHHRIQFFPGDEIPGGSGGGSLPEGFSAVLVECDLPVYMAVLNQSPDGAIVLNEATCLDTLE